MAKIKRNPFNQKKRINNKGQDFINWIILATIAFSVHLVATENQNIKSNSYAEIYKNYSQLTVEAEELKSIGMAFTDIIREFFLKQHKPFEFLIFGKTTNHINDVINEVTKQSQELQLKHEGHKFTSEVQSIIKWNNSQTYNKSAIVFVAKFDELLMFQDDANIDVLTFKLKHQFIIYIKDMNSFEKLKYRMTDLYDFNSLHRRIRQLRLFKFFIINSKHKVELIANSRYSDDCEPMAQHLLNGFNKKSQKWDKKLENFDHMRNFRGCSIGFYAATGFLYYPEGFTVETTSEQLKNLQIDALKDQNKVKGLMPEILKSMGKFGNFTPELLFGNDRFYDSSNINRIYDPNPITGTLNMLKNTIISYMDVYFLVTPNDPYTNYEKLTMPFDKLTWILLLTTSVFTFLTIFVIHRTSKRVKTKVFGEGVKMPAYNTLGIFFGIGQTQIPRETFSRLILLLFIWFCLIFRTCYQSKMFEFITTDMRKPTPETLEDLVRWNYTIVIESSATPSILVRSSGIIPSLESMRGHIMFVNQSDFTSSYKLSIDGLLSRHAFLVSDKNHAVFNASFKRSLTIMKTEQQSFAMSQHFYDEYLNILLDHMAYKLLPSGIPKYLYEHGMWSVYRPYDVEIEDPRVVLTMEMLDFGFIFWLVACGISTLAFLCETRSLWMRRKLRKIIGLINVIRVLRARLSDYHDGW